MTEIGCSLSVDIIYFLLPAEKGYIHKNRYCRSWDTGSDTLFTPCAVALFFNLFLNLFLNNFKTQIVMEQTRKKCLRVVYKS